MRVKNVDVKNKIIIAAKKEFFLKGYNNANMRTIADEAGITPGNIYRYFASKEELLDEIVGSVNKAISSLTKLENIVPSNLVLNSKALVDYLINVALDLAIKNKYETIILLSKVDGSKYEKSLQSFIEFTAKSIDKTKEESNMELSKVLARCVITTVARILEDYINDEDRIRKLCKEFLQTIFASFN